MSVLAWIYMWLNFRLAPQALTWKRNSIVCAPKPFVTAITIRPLQVDTTTQAMAKKKKLKTRSAAAKRFKVTGSGKVLCRHAGKQHLNEKKNKKHKKRLSKEQAVFVGDVRCFSTSQCIDLKSYVMACMSS
jgi:ribosomal protein L35